MNTSKGNPNLTAEEIEGFKEELQNLSNLIDDISEKSGRPTSLRENRRNLQKSLSELEKEFEERARDNARKEKKAKQLSEMLDLKEKDLAKTYKGDAQPEPVQNKLDTVQVLLDELKSREPEFKAVESTNEEAFSKYELFMDKVLLRRNELQNEIVPNSISLAKNINNLVTWFDTANGDLNNNIDTDKLTVCILTLINLRKTFGNHHLTLRIMILPKSVSGPCPCLAHVRVQFTLILPSLYIKTYKVGC